MKRMLFALVFAGLLCGCGAKNDVIRLPISGALNDPRAKDVLDPNIKLYFGKQGMNEKIITERLQSNKKTNAVGKKDVKACNWAFLSAMKTFQERAKKEGGTKVVGLTGYYYQHEFESETEFECGTGNIMVGVTFRGYIAK